MLDVYLLFFTLLLILSCFNDDPRSEDNTAEARSLLSLVCTLHNRVVPADLPPPRSSGSKTELCQYYCPICMMYHERISRERE